MMRNPAFAERIRNEIHAAQARLKLAGLPATAKQLREEIKDGWPDELQIAARIVCAAGTIRAVESGPQRDRAFFDLGGWLAMLNAGEQKRFAAKRQRKSPLPGSSALRAEKATLIKGGKSQRDTTAYLAKRYGVSPPAVRKRLAPKRTTN